MKMNRKEFKQMLTEWNRNFVNERNLSGIGVDDMGFTDAQKLFVKKVPIDLNLYALGDFEISTSEGIKMLSQFMLDAMKHSAHKEEILPKAIILDKACIESDLIPVLKLALDELTESGFEFSDFEGNIVQSKIVGIEKIQEGLREYAKKPEGLILYFARMSGSIENMADGTINKISTIEDESVWKNNLFWELMHDLFHAFEDVLVKSESYRFMVNLRSDPVIGEVIKNFKVPHASGGSSKDGQIKFSSSAGDYDNFASLVPYIRSLGNNENSKNNFIEECKRDQDLSIEEENKLRKFFESAHACYEEVGELLKGKVIIQKSHG